MSSTSLTGGLLCASAQTREAARRCAKLTVRKTGPVGGDAMRIVLHRGG
jgi:hypothetical protein